MRERACICAPETRKTRDSIWRKALWVSVAPALVLSAVEGSRRLLRDSPGKIFTKISTRFSRFSLATAPESDRGLLLAAGPLAPFRTQDRQKFLNGQRVNDIPFFNPPAPRHLNAVPHHRKPPRRMRISRDHNFYPAILRHSQMRILQIQSFRRRIAFQYDAMFVRSVQNPLHVVGIRVPPQNQSPRRMSDNLRVWILDRGENSIRHFRALQIHVRVNRNQNQVELRQN